MKTPWHRAPRMTQLAIEAAQRIRRDFHTGEINTTDWRVCSFVMACADLVGVDGETRLDVAHQVGGRMVVPANFSEFDESR
jgi:hypothetical protein